MSYVFSSESVSEGHPDKVADQISDAILDQFLAYDKNAHVAVETLCTTGQVMIAGEVRSSVYIDLQTIARRTINRIGYTKSEYQFDGNSCGILNAIHEQSEDINQGVQRQNPEDQGAGDQGMMFGYAVRETSDFMPLPIALSHSIMRALAQVRKQGRVMTYLRPDAKCQVTVRYKDDGTAEHVDTVVLSTQHDDMQEENFSETIKRDALLYVMPLVFKELGEDEAKRLFDKDTEYLVNPTGKFVIGGPHGDTGLTGRKIIVDTYGGRGAHGGGSFSGKDPSKVDRSATYMARYIAKNMVAAGVADEMLVQLSYAIGVAEPVNVYVNTYGRSHVKHTDGELAQYIAKHFPLRPRDIEERLHLRQPIYSETAAYGHMGRKYQKKTKTFQSLYHETKTMEVELFKWEDLDEADNIRRDLIG